MTGGKVLIVEDNPVNLRLAQFLLEKKGFTVRKAGSGAECLAEMARELPDIVLMDIQLPSEDGLAVTRKIRSDPRLKGVIVVALTAHAMAGDRERILAAGCDGYIPKPVDPQGLPDQAKAEIARLEEELRRSTEREAARQEELHQLEQQRVDQLGAMDAHLNAMRSAVERYLQQGRKAA